MVEFDIAHEENTEETNLVRSQNPWLEMDKLLLIFSALVGIGDGVEIYLPGLLNFEVRYRMYR